MNREEVERIDDQGMAAWNAHDADAFVAILADDFVWTDVSVPEPMRSKDEARAYTQAWITAFPDLQVKVVDRIVDGGAVAARLEFTGTNNGPMDMGGNTIPATGRAVVGKGAYFARIVDGKVAEFHTHPDTAGMMMQLGLMPGA